MKHALSIKYRYVPASHYVPAWRTDHPELECAKSAFPKLSPCTHALIARDEMQLAGFLRFWCQRGTLYDGGVWVEDYARRQGIAMAMWRRVLERYDPKRVKAHTISNEGRSLVAALMKDYPGMTWEITT